MVDSSDVISELLERFEPDRCYLCERKPFIKGVFFPSDSTKFGAPRGKERCMAYALCRKHFTPWDKKSMNAAIKNKLYREAFEDTYGENKIQDKYDASEIAKKLNQMKPR